MNSRKRRLDALRALCAELHPDDGVDPRDEKRRAARVERKNDHKVWQLCKQVAHTLHLALGALPDADALAGVIVQAVEPAPNAGRLRVTFAVADPRQIPEVSAVVERHAGRLRAEMAAAITRRRAPELVFAVVAGGDHA